MYHLTIVTSKLCILRTSISYCKGFNPVGIWCKTISTITPEKRRFHTSALSFIDEEGCEKHDLCLALKKYVANGREITHSERLTSRLNVYRQNNGKLRVEQAVVCPGIEFQKQQRLCRGQTNRQSESLHKDIQTTSRMCLTDALHNIYPAQMCGEQRNQNDCANKGHKCEELPAVFMIEKNLLNALLTLVSSNFLELQLRSKLLKLVNDVLHVDHMMHAIAKPHMDNMDDITCFGGVRAEGIQNSVKKCNEDYTHYHDVTLDQARIDDIINQEWHENDVKCRSCWENSALGKHSTAHVYFRKGVPQITQAHKQPELIPEGNRPSEEQLHLIVEKIQEEMLSFFENQHDYRMYSTDVLFKNRILSLKTRGLLSYKCCIQSMKYTSWICCADVKMEVLKITLQSSEDNVQVRWRVKGIPIHTHLISKILRRNTKYRYFDAFSTFYIGQDGLIHQHVLDKVMPSPEEKAQATNWVYRLALSLGLVRSPSLAGNCMSSKTVVLNSAARLPSLKGGSH